MTLTARSSDAESAALLGAATRRVVALCEDESYVEELSALVGMPLYELARAGDRRIVTNRREGDR